MPLVALKKLRARKRELVWNQCSAPMKVIGAGFDRDVDRRSAGHALLGVE